MNKSTVTIPAELLPEFEQWGRLTAHLFGRLRQEAGVAPKGVPDEQKWFWSKEWQSMESEADEAEENGEYVGFDNVEEAIQYLHEQV